MWGGRFCPPHVNLPLENKSQKRRKTQDISQNRGRGKKQHADKDFVYYTVLAELRHSLAHKIPAGSWLVHQHSSIVNR